MTVTNTQGNSGNFSGIEKYFYLQINIKNKQWIFNPEDLLRFLYEEEAGNLSPVCEFDLLIQDTSILQYLNEGNSIDVTIGGYDKLPKDKSGSNISAPNKQQFSVTVVRLEVSYDSFPFIQIYCSGIIGDYGYIANNNMSIIKQKSSVDAIKQVLKEDDEFTNIDSKTKASFKDTQNWVQYNISNKRFISNIWLHSYSPNNTLFLGINSNNTFILRDKLYLLEQITKKDFKYIFSNFSGDKDKNKVIQYDGILFTQSNSILNLTSCYNLNKLVYDLDNAQEVTISSDIKNMGISSNSKLNRNSSITNTSATASVHNLNVHDNYHLAYLSNIGNLMSVSGCKLILNFTNIFLSDLSILDMIYVTVNELDPLANSTAKGESGNYLVSRITRCIMNNKFTTTVACNRESINEMSGELR